MVAIEHRQKPTTTTTTTTTNGQEQQQQQQHPHNEQQLQQQEEDEEQQQQEITLEPKVEQQEPEQEQYLMTTSATTVKNSNTNMSKHAQESAELAKKHKEAAAAAIAKSSAISQRGVDIKISNKSNIDQASKELTKKVLKLDLSGKELDEYSLKSPKSPISARLSHQTSLTSSVDVEDRKTLREALYQGIFHRHRRTIFAVGSFLRMLRSRNSQYNTIRSSSEGEDMDEPR